MKIHSILGQRTQAKLALIIYIILNILALGRFPVVAAQPTITLQDIQEVRGLAFDPSGQVLAIGGRVNNQPGFWLYEKATGSVDVIETAGNLSTISWSPDGNYIAGDSGLGNTVVFQIFDVASKQMSVEFEHTAATTSTILWDSDSSRVATTNGATIYIRDAGTGIIVMSLSVLPTGTIYSLNSLAWDHSINQRIYGLVGGEEKTIFVWSTATGELIQQFSVPFHSESFALSPDFTKLAVGSLDGNGSILILDAFNGVPHITLQGVPGEFPQTLVWHPNSSSLATYGGGYGGGTIRVWDISTGQQTNSFSVTGVVPFDALVWTPDGNQLAYSAGQAPVAFVTPPIASAGPDQAVTDSDGTDSELVTLDGSVSSDPDGTIISYSWSEGGIEIATGVNPQVDLAVGEHTIALTVTDDDGATATDKVAITVNMPPTTP